VTDQDAVIGNEGWQWLITARRAYTHAVSPHYDEAVRCQPHSGSPSVRLPGLSGRL
jgi:hypothetical protein